MRKVTNFFFTNKRQDILQRIKQQFSIVVFQKTKLWQSFSCTHPASWPCLNCCVAALVMRACAQRQYIYTEGNNGNINESLEPCNNHTLKCFPLFFSDRFSNSEADEFRNYSFCKENHCYKLSFKLSKSYWTENRSNV
jgi:hypothetical protein